MKRTAVIMAGGAGTRFWPKGRKAFPKQFLSFTEDGKTMIQLTTERLLPMITYENMYIVTNEEYIDLVKKQLPMIPTENILAEPMMKNTAAAIGFAAAIISRKYDDALMIVLASDHLIKNKDLYLDTMDTACKVANENENLVTIGITPTYPETGYGYINFGRKEEDGRLSGSYRVKRFVEKPDLETAKKYLSSGEYLWNSGMFVWKVSTILKKFKKYLPNTYDGIVEIGKAFRTDMFQSVVYKAFDSFERVSVDYAIMEKADNIYTIPGNFGWDDVGSWLAIERINPTNEFGNVVQGDIIALDTKQSIIMGEKKLIAAIGLEDIIIVDTPDALLVCDKNYAQNIRDIIELLKENKREDLL